MISYQKEKGFLRDDAHGKFDEYWVDLAHQSAIVKVFGYADAAVLMKLDIQYQQRKDGWFPSGWTITSRSQDDEESVLHVKEFEFNPRLDQKLFDVELKPGMVVRKYNSSNGQKEIYQVQDNGSLRLREVEPKPVVKNYSPEGPQLQVTAMNTAAPDPPTGLNPLRLYAKWWWLPVSLLACVLGGIVWFRVRYRSQPRPKP